MRAHRESGKLRAGGRRTGKWTTEGASKGVLCGEPSAQNAEYHATCGHASVAGDMLVSRKERAARREARWHRGFLLVLDIHCQGRFFFP